MPRALARCKSTGVRKKTDVSRLRTAVTSATKTSATAKTAREPTGRRASSEPAAPNRPSCSATTPTSRSPATSTKAGQTCAAAWVKPARWSGRPVGQQLLAEGQAELLGLEVDRRVGLRRLELCGLRDPVVLLRERVVHLLDAGGELPAE